MAHNSKSLWTGAIWKMSTDFSFFVSHTQQAYYWKSSEHWWVRNDPSCKGSPFANNILKKYYHNCKLMAVIQYNNPKLLHVPFVCHIHNSIFFRNRDTNTTNNVCKCLISSKTNSWMQPLIKIPIDFKIQPIFKACHIHNKCHIHNANIFWTIKHAYTGSLLLFIVEKCSDHFIELI